MGEDGGGGGPGFASREYWIDPNSNYSKADIDFPDFLRKCGFKVKTGKKGTFDVYSGKQRIGGVLVGERFFINDPDTENLDVIEDYVSLIETFEANGIKYSDGKKSFRKYLADNLRRVKRETNEKISGLVKKLEQ